MTMDPGWPHVVQQTVLPLFLGTPRIPGAGCARYARCCFVGLRASAGVTKSMPRPKTQAANPTERDVIFIPAKGIKISPLIAPSPGPGRSALTQLRPKRGPARVWHPTKGGRRAGPRESSWGAGVREDS